MKVPLTQWLTVRRTYTQEFRLPHTILDPALANHTGIISFEREIDTKHGPVGFLELPQEDNVSIGNLIIVTDLQFAMNKVIQMYWTAKSEIGLKVAIEKYIDTLISSTFGKDGVLNRVLLGFRTANASFDGVLLADPDLDEKCISIPAEDAYKIHISYNDVVMVVRQPVLWKQSMIPRRVRFHSNRKVLYLHPTALPGLGGDCDGDRITVFKIEHTRMKNRLEELLEEDWHIDRKQRYAEVPYGHTISLQSVKNNTTTEDVNAHLHKDYMKFMEGLNDEDLEKEITTIVQDNVRMKLELGAAGSTSQKMRLIAASKEEMYAANRFSEWLTQGLLSIKHGYENVSVKKVNEMLEGAASFVYMYGRIEFINSFLKLGMPEDAIPILTRLLYEGGRLSTVVSRISPLYLATQNSPTAFQRAQIVQEKHPLISSLVNSTSSIKVSDFIANIEQELLNDKPFKNAILR